MDKNLTLPPKPTSPEEIDSFFDAVLLKFETMQDEIDKLKAQNNWLQRQIFGRKSEKLIPPPNPLQLSMDSLLAEVTEITDFTVETIEPNPSEIKKLKQITTPKKEGHGKDKFPDHLRKEHVEVKLPKDLQEKLDNGQAQVIGIEETQKLAFTPSELYIKVYQRKTVVVIEPDGNRNITTAPMPETPVELGRVDVSVVLYVVISKFMDHLPLYRQCAMFKRHGYNISANTLFLWITKFHEFIAPIVKAMWEDLTSGTLIQSDDTTMRILASGSKEKVYDGHIFVYIGNENWVYKYTRHRNQSIVCEHLHDYSGSLLCDGHNCYDKTVEHKKLKRGGCHSHARRYFVDAFSEGRKESEEMIAMYRELYALEAKWKEQKVSTEEKMLLRQEFSKPVLARMKTWCDNFKIKRSLNNTLGKAVTYTLNQWDCLQEFLHDGAMPIDNNASEEALRNVVLGKKNYIFLGNDTGAFQAANYYSILQTCKYLGINPVEYLTDIWEKFCTQRIESYAELTPKNWKKAKGI